MHYIYKQHFHKKNKYYVIAILIIIIIVYKKGWLERLSSEPRRMAVAEEKTLLKYSCLAPSHTIIPVAIEIIGAIGPLSLAFLKTFLRHQIREEKAGHYLLQELSVAVQRGLHLNKWWHGHGVTVPECLGM